MSHRKSTARSSEPHARQASTSFPTTIHNANDLLRCAEKYETQPATITRINQNVLLVGRTFEKEELTPFIPYLRHNTPDRWLQFNADATITPCTADEPLTTPTVYITHGLADRQPWNEAGDEPNYWHSEFAYIIVVRGRSGAMYSKLRIFYCLADTATGILEEAVAGYSVVFSAAMLKKDLERMANPHAVFKTVEFVEELYERRNETRERILICC